jgi:negative regulator of flagellin synthesis FlgM
MGETMTDPISNLGRTAAQLSNSDGVKNEKTSTVSKSVDDQIKAKTGSDELVLSETAETALANAEFDSAKVARIKAAIQEGNYPIDAKKVAESFAALEGMISSN